MTNHIKATYNNHRQRVQQRREHAEFQEVLRAASPSLRNELLAIASSGR